MLLYFGLLLPVIVRFYECGGYRKQYQWHDPCSLCID
jgi:hypothetical protein